MISIAGSIRAGESRDCARLGLEDHRYYIKALDQANRFRRRSRRDGDVEDQGEAIAAARWTLRVEFAAHDRPFGRGRGDDDVGLDQGAIKLLERDRLAFPLLRGKPRARDCD